jgi:hypothetical protein
VVTVATECRPAPHEPRVKDKIVLPGPVGAVVQVQIVALLT